MSYPDAWGVKYEEVQGLSWLAYKGNGHQQKKYRFSGSKSSWLVANVFETGGFRAVLVKGSGKTILSFSGTNVLSAEDWNNNIMQGVMGVAPYYALALYYARTNAADMVVGHSLGGGMASYCAIYGGKPAATINPAPLNLNLASGIAMIKNSSLVVNYVAPFEACDLLDKGASAMGKVGKIIQVSSTGFEPVTRHLIEYLGGFTPPVEI